MWKPNLQVSVSGILVDGGEVTGELISGDHIIIVRVVLAEHAVILTSSIFITCSLILAVTILFLLMFN